MSNAKGIGIGIGIGVAVVIVALLVIGSSVGSQHGIVPTQHTMNIVNSMIRVEPGQYNYYQFSAPAGSSGVTVSGTFTAGGGSGNDIKVLILDEQNFINYRNGHQANVFYSSGQETVGNINADVPTGQTLYLVYDNTFSVVSGKEVTTNVNLTYTN